MQRETGTISKHAHTSAHVHTVETVYRAQLKHTVSQKFPRFPRFVFRTMTRAFERARN